MQIKVHINGKEKVTLISSNSDEIQYLFEQLEEHLTNVNISVNELDHGNMKSRKLFNNTRHLHSKITMKTKREDK